MNSKKEPIEKRLHRALFQIFCAIFISFSVFEPSYSKEEGDTLKFIENVILGTEYGSHEKVCSRWVKSPTIALIRGSSEDERMFEKVIAELNDILKDADFSLKILTQNKERADIKIIFARLGELPTIADRNGCQYVRGNWGSFWIWPNKRHQIRKALILIASDKVKGRLRRHFLLEEITQSLGLANDSPIFRSSVFFERGIDGGMAMRFSALDRQLIRFFYKYIKPGDRREEVRKAFNLYWGK